MTLSVSQFQAYEAKASSFAGAFASLAAAAPSIVKSVGDAGPANVQAAATHAADVLSGMLTFAGHEIAVIEAIWPKLKPFLMMALDLAGNAPLAAIVQAIPSVAPASIPAAA